jgi:hypothetical protein
MSVVSMGIQVAKPPPSAMPILKKAAEAERPLQPKIQPVAEDVEILPGLEALQVVADVESPPGLEAPPLAAEVERLPVQETPQAASAPEILLPPETPQPAVEIPPALEAPQPAEAEILPGQMILPVGVPGVETLPAQAILHVVVADIQEVDTPEAEALQNGMVDNQAGAAGTAALSSDWSGNSRHPDLHLPQD